MGLCELINGDSDRENILVNPAAIAACGSKRHGMELFEEKQHAALRGAMKAAYTNPFAKQA